MKIILLLFLVCVVQLCFSQSILSNGDFEIYTEVPDDRNQVNRCEGWHNLNDSYNHPSYYGSPDYYHNFGLGNVQTPGPSFNVVYPYSGDAFVGFGTFVNIYSNMREYFGTELDVPMVTGHTYQISFWLTNGSDPSPDLGLGCNRFGIQFSHGPLVQNGFDVVPGVPQIEIPNEVWSTDWVEYTFTYVADANYSELSIGNFYDDSLTTYTQHIPGSVYLAMYYIDKLEIIDLSLNITGQSNICIGDSINLQGHNDSSYAWATSFLPNQIISTNSSINVSPTVTTTYVLYGTDDTANFTVNVSPYPNVNVGNDTTLCVGDEFEIFAGNPSGNYEWQNGSISPYFPVSEPGTYWMSSSINNCVATDTIVVTNYPFPYLSEDTTVCIESEFVVDVSALDGTYLWSDMSVDPIKIFNESGVHWVRTTINGCSTIDSINVSMVECNIELEMPNVFTPDFDGVNDILVPLKISGLTISNTKIFNRWGTLVFETNNPLVEWDGDVTSGTYFWVIKYVDLNDIEYNVQGNVTVIK